MKNITESINSSMIAEGLIPGRLTGDDKKNFKLISIALGKIVSEISDWMEEDEENEESNTADLARRLSQLRDQLIGEWDEEICFDFD